MTNPIPLRPVQKPDAPYAVLAGGLFTAFPTESAALSAARIAAQKDPGSLTILYAPVRQFRASLTISEEG